MTVGAGEPVSSQQVEVTVLLDGQQVAQARGLIGTPFNIRHNLYRVENSPKFAQVLYLLIGNWWVDL